MGRLLGEVGQTPSKLARRAIDDALRGVVGLNPVDDVTTSRASPCPFASDPPSTDPTRHPIGGVTWVYVPRVTRVSMLTLDELGLSPSSEPVLSGMAKGKYGVRHPPASGALRSRTLGVRYPNTRSSGGYPVSPATKRSEKTTGEPTVFGVPLGPDLVGAAAPQSLLELAHAEPQKAFPAIAKDPEACARIQKAVQGLPTIHRLHNGDSRSIELEPGSADLVVTSPPYWTLKKYNDHESQLGDFLDELDEVWRRSYDALVPGGRIVVVVGDVNVSRRPSDATLSSRCTPASRSVAGRSASTTSRRSSGTRSPTLSTRWEAVDSSASHTNPTVWSRTTSSTSCFSASLAGTGSLGSQRG